VLDAESEVGVLYEVGDADLDSLDRSESVPAAYRRETVVVEDSEGREREAVTYVANRTGDFLPHRDYLALIVQGRTRSRRTMAPCAWSHQ
jgi:gamma-glutamylcyclotransferase (GGCT)/AIG2-like uncharacterized protein YtfP